MRDVIVIGAGPGGSVTAYYLAKAGLDVLFVDKADFPRDKTCGDGLTPRALGILDELAVLPTLKQKGFVMAEATVFSPTGKTITTHMPKRSDMPAYMLTVPRMILDETLRQKAIEAGAIFQGRVHVKQVEQHANGVCVMGNNFKEMARMVVVAVGASVRLLLDLGILSETPNMILAARAYYEGLQNLSGQFDFHFDGVPLPGYGWIFPLSDSTANIGAGILKIGRRGKKMPATAKMVLDEFLKTPSLAPIMSHAKRVGSVKGYPLRTDFATAPTHAPRMLLVGEAAGLVNPVTGEGVDYAMESGKMAAEHLLQAFAEGDFSLSMRQAYDQALRDKFQRLFVFSSRIRDWYLNKTVINRLVYVANRKDELRELFTDIVLGNADAGDGFSAKTLAQIAFTI